LNGDSAPVTPAREIVAYKPTEPVGDIQTLKRLLSSESIQARIKDAVATHIKPEQMLKMLLMTTAKNPKLLKCTQESVIMSLLTAGQVGLDFTGVLGQAYLVPYLSECQFQIGYRGLVTLIGNARLVTTIYSEIVYKGDEFKVIRGTRPEIIHVPVEDRELPEKEGDIHELVRAAYCVSVTDTGQTQFTVMWRSEIDRIRARAQAWKAFKSGAIKSTPWATDYAEMAKKTVLKRHSKYLPMSIDKPGIDRVYKAIEIDDAGYGFGGEGESESEPNGKKQKVDLGKPEQKPEPTSANLPLIKRITDTKTEEELDDLAKNLKQEEYESVCGHIDTQRKRIKGEVKAPEELFHQ